MRAWRITAVVTLLLWAQGAVAGTLLVLGDSISAGLGLDTSLGWVSLLDKRLKEQGFDYQVVNASISGDTTAGGLARLPGEDVLALRERRFIVVRVVVFGLCGERTGVSVDGVRGAIRHHQLAVIAQVAASEAGAQLQPQR